MIIKKCACGCGQMVETTLANAKRGWGIYATKSCKAKAQERRTGQHRQYMRNLERVGDDLEAIDADHQAGLDSMEAGWDGHKAGY